MSGRKVHIYCGNGAGKTSAALGKGIREASMGKSVIVIQFLKEKYTDRTAEYFKRLEPELRMFRFQKFPENYENLSDREREDECRNIKNGLNFARKVLVTGECDILILDEILGLTDRGIVPMDELRELIDSVGEGMELYLTGTSLCRELWNCVDEVTEMTAPDLPQIE
ncbi:MAG: cob(I)yrinic acid a,c-diamide adenosyltransferase [Lachnospiraceae bacterium]|nr:cob(I)yrinic acid a,c-diamide adenosyltransferase [Lachnospiraceae bacterium]